MNRLLIACFFSMFFTSVYSQRGIRYQADLDSLYGILKKTPSFKEQLSGDQLPVFLNYFDSLRTDTAQLKNDQDIFYRLAKLFFPLRDNHLAFYQFAPIILDPLKFTDTAAIAVYRSHAFYREYPAYAIKADSLEKALKRKPVDSVEGIYYYGSYLTIGLFRTAIKNELVGIVLKTSMPNWEKGQVAIRLYEYMPHSFRGIYGHPLLKHLVLYNNEKFRNRSLINSSFYASVSESIYKKDTIEKDYVNINTHNQPFEFRPLSETIQYLKLGNFSAMDIDMEVSQKFYDSIRNKLAGINLVVDLRNNTGGAQKVSRKFFTLIDSFAKAGKVYVLINNATMSQGEIFTLQLKRNPNIITYGQTTQGTITYGSNYGKRVTLPSGKYEVYITDMKGFGDYLVYENFGVSPDVVLKNDGDWIKKIVTIIGNK